MAGIEVGGTAAYRKARLHERLPAADQKRKFSTASQFALRAPVRPALPPKTPSSAALDVIWHNGCLNPGRQVNNRRKLLIALGITAYSPQCLFAQAKKPLVVIGWLHLGSRES